MGNGGSSQACVDLRTAIEAGNVESVMTLVLADPDLLIGAKDEATGYFPVHLALAYRQLEMFSAIIDIIKGWNTEGRVADLKLVAWPG